MGRQPTVPIYLRQRRWNKDDALDTVLTGVTRSTSSFKPDGDEEFFLQPADVVRFGEVADRPPDLQQFAKKIELKKRKQQPQPVECFTDEGAGGSDDDEAEARQRTANKRRRRDVSEMSTSVDDSYNPSNVVPTPKVFPTLQENKLKASKNTAPSATTQEMEIIRMKAMQAYDALRKKRLAQRGGI
jgi:hypothetical protein